MSRVFPGPSFSASLHLSLSSSVSSTIHITRCIISPIFESSLRLPECADLLPLSWARRFFLSLPGNTLCRRNLPRRIEQFWLFHIHGRAVLSCRKQTALADLSTGRGLSVLVSTPEPDKADGRSHTKQTHKYPESRAAVGPRPIQVEDS